MKELEHSTCKKPTDIQNNPGLYMSLTQRDSKSCFYHDNIYKAMKKYELYKCCGNREHNYQTGQQRSQACPCKDTSVCDRTSQYLPGNHKQDRIHQKVHRKKNIYIQFIVHIWPSFSLSTLNRFGSQARFIIRAMGKRICQMVDDIPIFVRQFSGNTRYRTLRNGFYRFKTDLPTILCI